MAGSQLNAEHHRNATALGNIVGDPLNDSPAWRVCVGAAKFHYSEVHRTTESWLSFSKQQNIDKRVGTEGAKKSLRRPFMLVFADNADGSLSSPRPY